MAKLETTSTRVGSFDRFVIWWAPLGPLAKEDAVPGLKVALAVWRAERRCAGHDDEQLVVPELIVVRERALAWQKLKEAGTKVVSGNALSTPSKSWLVRRPRSLHPTIVSEQVHLHAAKSRTERS